MGIKVLDCTLRECAYVTNPEEINKADIIKGLELAGIDIIEAGWLKDEQDKKLKTSCQKALMFDYGKYDIERVLSDRYNAADIIRIAFHKKSIDEISFTAEKIKSKGYKIFLQPCNIKEYTELEIQKLCRRANFIGVDTLYIVDSFGSMFPEDLYKIMPVFDKNTDRSIQLGFHSHNNIQLSFALSIQFINHMQKRDIIVDSTLCGIGRGAGNTKTELLLEYLNKYSKKYNTNAIWQTIENNISPLYKGCNWEYTPVRGQLGIKNLHP